MAKKMANAGDSATAASSRRRSNGRHSSSASSGTLPLFSFYLVMASSTLLSLVRPVDAQEGSVFSSTCKSSFDALQDMSAITQSVEPDAFSIVARGGAAGGGGYTVSEGQAYGVLASAIALASLDESDPRKGEVSEKFRKYFNGWKKMCENSSPAPCQSLTYCDGGKTACLPGWKHTSDLNEVDGTGAAPDGDEDAIAGMIIAIKAVESDSARPSWYEEVRDWADRSCTQFLKDNTKMSGSQSHRLLKLGTCWGGWEDNGNNPSYHSPGQYRLMRDFQEDVGSTSVRTYSLPDLNGQSLTQAWDMLIDTSYKALTVAQCPSNGLVPNWALFAEVDSQTLGTHQGYFFSSGTSQYEFGADASRTMWRIAFDAAVFPVESAAHSGLFLSPLLERMADRFNPSASNVRDYFESSTLQTCEGVTAIFGNWRNEGFMFGPVYSSLVSPMPASSFKGKSYSQQDMVDSACEATSNIGVEVYYYPRSWMVLATMTLNGGLNRVGEILRGTSASPGPTPQPAPTFQPQPTPAPVPAPTDQPVIAPTKQPVVPTNPPVAGPPTSGCCSQNMKDCVSWCGDTEDSCLNCSNLGVFWIAGAQAGCLARWEDCTNNINGCCDSLSCVEQNPGYRQCVVSSGGPSRTNPPVASPTNPPATPTNLPVPAPTDPPVAPTNPPVLAPTDPPVTPTNQPVTAPTDPPVTPTDPPVAAPTDPPVTNPSSGCCSHNLKDCISWCGTTQESCLNCSNADVYWIAGGARSGCLARYIACTNNETVAATACPAWGINIMPSADPKMTGIATRAATLMQGLPQMRLTESWASAYGGVVMLFLMHP
eukprot:CAMPEP_0113569684 /NCGR_PEP_ID=MMETSP0015_2-20120614/24549_1 /TAXON_ID=2838 /ORGANISM="Odontella" /LENGTH=821 /DNA_ID=CAMNT_0000472379 /DNA_START=510 /DNA_END=2972 /DNA_ORIENTATION=- /assembly_acc=CAM_ASM_000160